MIHLSGISLYPHQELRNAFLNFLIKAKEQGILVSLDLNYRQKL